MKRQQRIKALLSAIGADVTNDNVDTVELFISDVPTEYLRHFTEYVLKNYDRYKKPMVNITTASQEYKKRLRIAFIKQGKEKLQSVEETRAFLQEFFRGAKIANCVEGLYLPFVTISLGENGAFMNDYAKEKLNSKAESDFYFWCFHNQERIGDIKLIESEKIQQMMIANQNRIKELSADEVVEPNENTTVIQRGDEVLTLEVKKV